MHYMLLQRLMHAVSAKIYFAAFDFSGSSAQSFNLQYNPFIL